LGKLIGTMYVTAVLFVLLVLVPVVILFRIPARRFYRAVRQPFLIAFSTASSEAALPLALENMEEFGVPKHIVGFVLPPATVSTWTAARCTSRLLRSSSRREPASTCLSASNWSSC